MSVNTIDPQKSAIVLKGGERIDIRGDGDVGSGFALGTSNNKTAVTATETLPAPIGVVVVPLVGKPVTMSSQIRSVTNPRAVEPGALIGALNQETGKIQFEGIAYAPQVTGKYVLTVLIFEQDTKPRDPGGRTSGHVEGFPIVRCSFEVR